MPKITVQSLQPWEYFQQTKVAIDQQAATPIAHIRYKILTHASEEGRKGFVNGVIATYAALVLQLFVNTLFMGITISFTILGVAKKTLELTVYSIFGGMFWGVKEAVHGYYDASTREAIYDVDLIKFNQFSTLIARDDCRPVLDELLDDPDFIEEEAAYEVRCLVTQEFMADPVITPCNHVFERDALLAPQPEVVEGQAVRAGWISSGHNSCPYCVATPLTEDNILRDFASALKVMKVADRALKYIGENQARFGDQRYHSIGLQELRTILTYNLEKIETHTHNALNQAKDVGHLSPGEFRGAMRAFGVWFDD